MTSCEREVLEVCSESCSEVYAWCILPNHYHLLINTDNVKLLRKELGKFHGRSSYYWNQQDETKGRKVWFNCFERPIAVRRAFLGEPELYPSQSRSPWIRGALAGLAMVKRSDLSRAGRASEGRRDLEVISASGIREELGYLKTSQCNPKLKLELKPHNELEFKL